MHKLSLLFFGRLSLKKVCSQDSLALLFPFCLGSFGLAELKNMYDLELKIVFFSAVAVCQVANAGYTCGIVSL